jgi:long-subunit acyl-CoA synthetase (AMP-forming)/alkylation response protein AidB-like acyl-CoA dehydrogenase
MNPLLPHPPAAASRRRAHDQATALVDLLERRIDESPEAAAIATAAGDGIRSWSWAELCAAAVGLADALGAAGLARGDRVAHVGPHGPDWIVVDLACLLAGVEHAALHHDAAAAERGRLLAWLAPRAVVHSGGNGDVGVPAAIVVEPVAGSRAVERVRVAGLGAPEWRQSAADVRHLRAVIAGCADACDPDAVCTVLLSSGTTGMPRGYLHTQRALAANAAAACEMFLSEPRDVRLSWLPASHGMARVGDLYTALVRGGCLHVVRDRRQVLDACRLLPPTVILGVPAFFERIERGVRSGRIADLPATLGGRVRVCVSGGAALRQRTAECFAARGVPLVEGYGLAEAGPVVAVSNPRIARAGTVGPPLPGVEVRIDDREASRGQVLVRTPSRAVAVIHPADRDGDARTVVGAPATDWIETGDVGDTDADGHLRITGRLRDTLVLATGVKVPPAEVERALAEDEAVAQVCVVGDGLPWPVAIVVPEPEVFRAAVRRVGARVFSRRQALAHPRVLAWLARRLARRQAGLPRAWRVRRAFLVGRPFDAAHGEATESLKVRRDRVADHFAAPIAAAAAAPPPAWACAVEPEPAAPADAGGAPGLAAAVWRGAAGGFAAAAARAALPPREAAAAIVDRALGVIAELRREETLYDPPAGALVPPAPLADAPRAPVGRFSAAAEAALAAAGLWGLAVPEAFGGAGAGMLDLARAITRLAADCPTAAGMLAVHSSIGAVSAVAAFGTAEQRARHLPGLAVGAPLSIFGATEPEVGCDLGAVSTRLERRDGRLLLTGTKMFITNAVHGRLVKLLAMLDGRPAVALVRLPAEDGPTFRLRRYALHPLKHAHNAALEFTGHEVDESDILPAPGGDGMRIVWHGLNRGRVTLAAQAAGTLRILLAQARAHALGRSTWGRPIADRELVRGRLARIAAGIAACDAVSAWAAAAIDAGGSGELEAIVAKTTASTCVRDAALDALGVHGGRAFLVGHPLGDSLHDHLAVGVYEGESDLLGLALLKGIAKAHPLAGAARDGSRAGRAAAWLAWRVESLAQSAGHDRDLLDRRLRDHARAARQLLARTARRIDRALRRHGRGLAERQLLAGALAADVRDLAAALAACRHADATADDAAAADCFCRIALARVRGEKPTPADHAALAALGAAVVNGPS